MDTFLARLWTLFLQNLLARLRAVCLQDKWQFSCKYINSHLACRFPLQKLIFPSNKNNNYINKYALQMHQTYRYSYKITINVFTAIVRLLPNGISAMKFVIKSTTAWLNSTCGSPCTCGTTSSVPVSILLKIEKMVDITTLPTQLTSIMILFLCHKVLIPYSPIIRRIRLTLPLLKRLP